MAILARALTTIVDLYDPIQSGTAPVPAVVGMLWLDTSNPADPQLFRWDGISWIAIGIDEAYVDALVSTKNSISYINNFAERLNIANPDINDLIYDLADKKIYKYEGLDGSNQPLWGDITNVILGAAFAKISQVEQTKATVFYAPATEPPIGATKGDLWLDSTNRKLFYFNNGWVPFEDAGIAKSAGDIDSIIRTITGGTNIFRRPKDLINGAPITGGPPHSISLPNDFWFDTDSADESTYRFENGAWVLYPFKNIIGYVDGSTASYMSKTENRAALISMVTGSTVMKNLLDTKVSDNQALYESFKVQTASFIIEQDKANLSFKDTTHRLAVVDSKLNPLIDSIETFFNFSSSGLLINRRIEVDGVVTADRFSILISNQRISFFDGIYEVAYINDREMFIRTLSISQLFTIGSNNLEEGFADFAIIEKGLAVTWRYPDGTIPDIVVLPDSDPAEPPTTIAFTGGSSATVNSELTLTWSMAKQPSSGGAIIGYEIHQQAPSANYERLTYVETGNTFGSVTFTAPPEPGVYYYKMFAKTAYVPLNSTWSIPIALTVAGVVVTSAQAPILSVQTSPLNAGDTAQLNWAGAVASNMHAIIGYTIQVKKDSGTYELLTESSIKSLAGSYSYTLPGGAAVYTYRIMVNSANANYSSAWSNIPSLTVNDAGGGSTPGSYPVVARTFPSYWNSNITAAENRIIAAQDEGAGSNPSFAFITDIHTGIGFPTYRENSNYRESPGLLYYILTRCNINKYIDGGDISLDGGGNTRTETITNFQAAENAYSASGSKALKVVGNHDYIYGAGYSSAISHPDMTTLFLRNFTNQPSLYVFDVNNPNWCYYYHDDPSNLIRYIILNSQDKPAGASGDQIMHYPEFRSAQSTWFQNVALNTPNRNWSVVVASHTPPGTTQQNNSYASSAAPGSAAMVAMLDAYRTKTGVFSGANKGGSVIAWLGGHGHVDTRFNLSGSSVNIVQTTGDGTDPSNYSAQGFPFHQKTRYTDTEQAFDVFTVNKTTGLVTITRIGAGLNNREFYYK